MSIAQLGSHEDTKDTKRLRVAVRPFKSRDRPFDASIAGLKRLRRMRDFFVSFVSSCEPQQSHPIPSQSPSLHSRRPVIWATPCNRSNPESF